MTNPGIVDSVNVHPAGNCHYRFLKLSDPRLDGPDYVKETTLSSLSALLKSSADKSPDDEKLLDLYRNRNELKKEFAELRDEKFVLQDKIKKQEGAIARLQQKLEHLEDILIDPEWARNGLVHYQMRGAGQRCQRKLDRFAEQLKQQREAKQQGQAMADWEAENARDRQAIESRIGALRDTVLQLEETLQAENRRLGETSGLLRPFRGRSINARIEKLTQQILEEEQEQESLRTRLEEIDQREPPETAGLDLLSKRSINYMILAFAQQLYLLFEDDELVSLVKEAGEKSAGAIKYGNDRDCESLLERLRRGMDNMEKGGDFAELLKRRAKLISERAVFQNDDDAVPAAGTVATLYRIGSNGIVTESDANILGDNYWGIASFLSR